MKDYQKEITDEIIRALEAGTAPWQKPWDAGEIPLLPYNATTNRPYQGGNLLWLFTAAAQNGYGDPRWCTYKQAQGQGWQVKKGEHGVSVVYWKRTETVNIKDPETGQETKAEVKLDHPFPFRAVVFNARQIEGMPALDTRSVLWDPIDRAEAILTGSGAKITHGGDKACYRPVPDDIQLPVRAAFADAGAYYDTALHELGHWTGHETRLNRQFGHQFRDPEYAREELRAEIASFFVSAETGLPRTHDEQHVAYVASWIRALKDDKHEIFRAARDAEQITGYLLNRELQRDQAGRDQPEGTGTELTPGGQKEPEPVRYYEPPKSEQDWGHDR